MAEGGGRVAASALMTTPLLVLLAASAAASLGMYAFAMGLNDLVDHRRDRGLHPNRPIAAGRVGLDGATLFLTTSLILSLLASAVFGISMVVAMLCVAVGVLVLNAMGKFVPALGLTMVGVLHALHMLAPGMGIGFLWPTWLIFTHTVLLGGIAYALTGRRPRIGRRTVLVLVLSWVGATALTLGVSRARTGAVWPAEVSTHGLVFVLILVGLLGLMVWTKYRGASVLKPVGAKVQRYASLWMPLYGCAWLLGQGLIAEGMIMVTLAVAGVLGMTVLREVFALIEHPVGYRR